MLCKECSHFLTTFHHRVWVLLCCILHPGKLEEGEMVGGTLPVSFAVHNVLRVNWQRVNNSCSCIAQCVGFLSRQGELRDRYQPCLFTPHLEVHPYTSMVSRTTQLPLVQTRSASSASHGEQARTVGQSHDGSIVNTKIKKNGRIISIWDLQRILRGLGFKSIVSWSYFENHSLSHWGTAVRTQHCAVE